MGKCTHGAVYTTVKGGQRARYFIGAGQLFDWLAILQVNKAVEYCVDWTITGDVVDGSGTTILVMGVKTYIVEQSNASGCVTHKRLCLPLPLL